MPTPRHPAIRELDRRHEDGIDLSLLWDQPTDQLFLQVRDDDAGLSVTFDIDRADALAAFRRPDEYLRPWSHGFDTRTRVPTSNKVVHDAGGAR